LLEALALHATAPTCFRVGLSVHPSSLYDEMGVLSEEMAAQGIEPQLIERIEAHAREAEQAYKGYDRPEDNAKAAAALLKARALLVPHMRREAAWKADLLAARALARLQKRYPYTLVGPEETFYDVVDFGADPWVVQLTPSPWSGPQRELPPRVTASDDVPPLLPPARSPADPPVAPPAPDPEVEAVVLAAVRKDPTIQSACRVSAARGGPCVFAVEPGEGTCPAALAALHPCLWSVGLLSDMGSHASRFATVLVHPNGEIVGVADLACAPASLSEWAKLQRLRNAGREPECPAELPVIGTLGP
jgi:hypothetical protein